MSVLVILTWVALGVLVGALAVYLLAIVALAVRIRHTAGLILFGLRAIAEQAAPIGPIVKDVNGDLADVRDALQAVLQKASPAAGQEEPGIVEPSVERAEPGR